ncbi:MAG: MBOAT family O-acyltransferase [Alphaproteobacteria bacterium]
MLFQTIDYLVLLGLSLAGFFAVPQKWRWAVLLGASYWFYGSWRPEYLGLLLVSTAIDYGCGLGMMRWSGRLPRRALLWTSVACNLGILAYFKYRIFLGGIAGLTEPELLSAGSVFADFVLPVGLSFYTLQSMGYTIDVHRGVRAAERHAGYFALYVAFFPQLVAGPIERSTVLLPQLRAFHAFDWDRCRLGGQLILLGLFKKLVVADSLAPAIAGFYADPAAASPGQAMVVGLLGLPYVYLDFSAYTDIALGSALMFGIRLSENFRRPLSAGTIRDFWLRWHITLSRWVFDYFHRSAAEVSSSLWWRRIVLLVTFTLIGLWHGPAWTFVLFGVYHGVIVLLENAAAERRWHWPAGRAWNALRIVRTQLLLAASSFLFLAPDLETTGAAFGRVAAIVVEGPGNPSLWLATVSTFAIAGMLAVWLLNPLADRGYTGRWLGTAWRPARWAFYYACIFVTLAFQAPRTEPFVYFQF